MPQKKEKEQFPFALTSVDIRISPHTPLPWAKTTYFRPLIWLRYRWSRRDISPCSVKPFLRQSGSRFMSKAHQPGLHKTTTLLNQALCHYAVNECFVFSRCLCFLLPLSVSHKLSLQLVTFFLFSFLYYFLFWANSWPPWERTWSLTPAFSCLSPATIGAPATVEEGGALTLSKLNSSCKHTSSTFLIMVQTHIYTHTCAHTLT